MRRYYSYRPPLTRGQRIRLLCLLLGVVLIAFCLILAFHLHNTLSSLAVTRVSNTVNRVVTAAVNDTVSSGEIQYDSLIHFEKDNEGRITALETDMAEFNRIQAQIVSDVLARMSEVSTTELAIPLGTLSGVTLLAGRAHEKHTEGGDFRQATYRASIRIRMQFVGSSTARFENEFTEAGINQTKHRIMLTVDVSVSILLPGVKAYTKVSNTFSVAETIIVGTVPDSYVHFNGSYEEAEDYVMNNAGP